MARSRNDPVRLDRLYHRALLIQERRANGQWLPIVRHLAAAGHAEGMLILADWLSDHESARATSSYRRAYRRGSGIAAQHLAMEGFNRNDLVSYRHWLRLAARAGDQDASKELKRFETRLPHANARNVGRLRPMRRIELR